MQYTSHLVEFLSFPADIFLNFFVNIVEGFNASIEKKQEACLTFQQLQNFWILLNNILLQQSGWVLQEISENLFDQTSKILAWRTEVTLFMFSSVNKFPLPCMKERNNKHSLNRVSVFLVSRPTTPNFLRTTKMIIYFHIIVTFAMETIFNKAAMLS